MKPFALRWNGRGMRVQRLKGLGKLPDRGQRCSFGGRCNVLLTEPLAFEPADSGTEKGAITYCGLSGREVTLKVSRPITGWKPFREHIYQADVRAGWTSGRRVSGELYYRTRGKVLALLPQLSTRSIREAGGSCTSHGTLDKETLGPLPYGPWKVTEKASKVSFPVRPQAARSGQVVRPGEVRGARLVVDELEREYHTHQEGGSRKTGDHAAAARQLHPHGGQTDFFVDNALEELDRAGRVVLRRDGEADFISGRRNGEDPEGKVSRRGPAGTGAD